MTDEQYEVTKKDVLTVMNAFPGLDPHWEAVFRSQPDLKDQDVLAPLADSVSD